MFDYYKLNIIENFKRLNTFTLFYVIIEKKLEVLKMDDYEAIRHAL